MPLVGREADLEQLCRLLARADTRLVTLTGPPGVGKTRLAAEVVPRAGETYSGGACTVALANLRDPALVADTMRRALDLPERGSQAPLDAVAAHCGARSMLLVLDNFEHLLPAAQVVAELMARCPILTILVTSRSPLRVRGENEFAVSPLGLPPAGERVSTRVLREAPAVVLFEQRALAILRQFEMTDADLPTMAAICRRLDGLPLAIELVTPWLRVLTPQALLERLDCRLGLLIDGARDLPERQRTMRATLEWSHDLLRAEQRALFRRMSVFGGGASLDDLEGICQAAGPLPGGALRWLNDLVAQSLVQAVAGGNRTLHVRMLETIREYAGELLAASGEADVTRHAHAKAYLALAAGASAELVGAAQQARLEQLDREYANLRAVMSWAHQRGDTGLGLELAVSLRRYWERRALRREGRWWLDRFLDEGPDVVAALRVKGLHAAGFMAFSLSDLEGATARFDEALRLARQTGDKWGEAAAVQAAGLVAHLHGDYRRAADLLTESLVLFRALGDQVGVADSLTNLASSVLDLGDRRRAQSLCEESLDVWRRLGNQTGMALSLTNLGELVRLAGDLDRAEVHLDEAIGLSRQLNHPRRLAMALAYRGYVARCHGRLEEARRLYLEGIGLFRLVEDQVGMAYCLERLAGLAAAEGEAVRAANLRGAAGSLRQAVGAPTAPVPHPEDDRSLDMVAHSIGSGAFAAACAAGAALSPADALALAASDHVESQ